MSKQSIRYRAIGSLLEPTRMPEFREMTQAERRERIDYMKCELAWLEQEYETQRVLDKVVELILRNEL
ncbi:MAG TPA: hypothetical protein VK466_07560 [Terriglobales bacterium]|nr:hypothetical protein [Terriglobales bacterium]